MTEGLQQRVLEGDREAIDLVLVALRASEGDLGPAALALGMTYQELAELWRAVPEIDQAVMWLRAGRC